jgi:hypothetical protein
MKKTSDAMNKAVRLLMAATDNEAILMACPAFNLYLVPAVLENGRLEYQVSNGMPGRRSGSLDFNNLGEAVACFNRLKDEYVTYGKAKW